MKFRNSLKISLVVFLLLLSLLFATWLDSYYWAEPTTDADYHVRGVWLVLGWVITFSLTLLIFLVLVLIGSLKSSASALLSYFMKFRN